MQWGPSRDVLRVCIGPVVNQELLDRNMPFLSRPVKRRFLHLIVVEDEVGVPLKHVSRFFVAVPFDVVEELHGVCSLVDFGCDHQV